MWAPAHPCSKHRPRHEAREETEPCWGRPSKNSSETCLTARLAGFGVSLHRNAIFLVRDADEVTRKEAALLHQPREGGYAGVGGAACTGGTAGETVCSRMLSSEFGLNHISFWTEIAEFVALQSAQFPRYFAILDLCIKWGSILAYGMSIIGVHRLAKGGAERVTSSVVFEPGFFYVPV